MTATTRLLKAATGNQLTAQGWQQEAALRMLHNNLDPSVAEKYTKERVSLQKKLFIIRMFVVTFFA